MKKYRLIVFIMMLLFSISTVLGSTIMPNVQIKQVKVHFIDTGNSDSILIEDNGKTALIDGADNDDEKLIVNYLNSLQLKKIDYVILTHPDADHVGGLDSVINNFDIGTVLIGNGSADTKTYKEFVQAAIDKKLKPSVPLENVNFTLGNGSFKFYNTKSQAKDVNDRSLVMLYTNGTNKFLFTGDAGTAVEKTLPLNEIGKIDVLKVGHHGSATSSGEEFIKALSPKYSVICVGENNKYNHPMKSVLDTLNKYKSTIYRTDLNGNIIMTSDGTDISVETNKKEIEKQIDINNKEGIQSINTIKENDINSSKIVYTTKTGKKYHRENCKTLKSKIKSTIKEAIGAGLEACNVCRP